MGCILMILAFKELAATPSHFKSHWHSTSKVRRLEVTLRCNMRRRLGRPMGSDRRPSQQYRIKTFLNDAIVRDGDEEKERATLLQAYV